MKKSLSSIVVLLMLLNCLAVFSSAASADVEFSAKGSTGSPDDIVTYEIYLDKNAGLYCAGVEVYYDNEALSLVSAECGDVFEQSEYAASPLNQEQNGNGYLKMIAECESVTDKNTNTGLFYTLSFQILKNATNGDHEVRIEFPDGGKGWFFCVTDVDKFETVDRSVACTKQACITVIGSSATVAPETNENGVVPQTSEGETTKAPVTAYVTDEEGKLIKNEDGKYETYVVTDKKADLPQYVTDTDGEPVTDEEGNYETYYENGDPAVTTEASTTAASSQPSKNTPAHRLILIGSIAAVIVAAVVVIIVVTTSKKKDDPESDQ